MARGKTKAQTRQQRKPYAFSEGLIVAAAELDIDPSDDTIADRKDGPIGVTPKRLSKEKRKRKIKSKPLKISDTAMMEICAVSKPLWDLHLELQPAFEHTPGDGGRPCEYVAADALVFWLAKWSYGGERPAERNLADLQTWKRLRKAVKRAHPDNKRFRLSKRPPSRDQYRRFRKAVADRAEFDKMLDKIDAISILIATSIGLFNRNDPFSTPSSTSCIISDGTWIPALYKARIEEAVDPETGEKLHAYDPEALQYTRDSKGNIVRSAGHHAVITEARAPHPGERVPLSVRLLAQPSPDNPQSECTLAIDMAFKLINGIEGEGGKVCAFIYDMAMHQTHRDRLLDAGIIPVGKVQRTKGGHYAYRNLGKHKFKLTDGTMRWLKAEAIDGSPAVAFRDSAGNEHYAVLERIKAHRDYQAMRIVVWGHWRLPDVAGVPKKLRGAVVLICHNSTPDEINNSYRRTRALSVLPETDPRGEDLLGLRQDVESLNSDLKARLPRSRAGTIGRNPLLFELAGYQLFTGIKALVHYMRRLGLRKLEDWFGTHKIPPNT
ncbi:hypothetical protein [Candidatus Poriferisodalis sp.]|uniref:hypothetical protein n=1 Tax=Candidatus Poriferisodalis sp. TaxID=3101277 RepID=UPI003B022353